MSCDFGSTIEDCELGTTNVSAPWEESTKPDFDDKEWENYEIAASRSGAFSSIFESRIVALE